MQLRTLDRSRQRRRPGFTLMEVLVVVAILVVLASLGIGVFFYLDSAKERTAFIQIRNIETAVEGYRALNGNYPETLDELAMPQGDKPAPLAAQHLVDPWNRKYIYDPSQLHPATHKPKIYSQGANPNNPNGYVSNW
jgi:general secretion pathway protein G